MTSPSSLVPAIALALALLEAPAAAEPPATPGPLTLSTEPRLSDAAAARARRLSKLHRVLQISTASSLAVTAFFLGTVAGVNQPTWFGGGQCAGAGGSPVFGVTYGCGGGASLLHGVMGVISVSLYVGTETLDYVRPRLEPERPGARASARHALRWVHRVGIGLTPFLGLIAAHPEWIGVTPGLHSDFQKGVRSIHLLVGAITAAAYIATTTLEE